MVSKVPDLPKSRSGVCTGKVNGMLPLQVCPHCSSVNITRSRRRNLGERSISILFLPYRCLNCYARFFQLKWHGARNLVAGAFRLLENIRTPLSVGLSAPVFRHRVGLTCRFCASQSSLLFARAKSLIGLGEDRRESRVTRIADHFRWWLANWREASEGRAHSAVRPGLEGNAEGEMKEQTGPLLPPLSSASTMAFSTWLTELRNKKHGRESTHPD